MKLLRIEQRSEEWFKARAGIATASEVGALVTEGGGIAKGKGVETYMFRKLAERWMGRPLETGQSKAMDMGTVLEDEALPAFELATGLELEPVGFALNESLKLGFSPDSMVKGTNRGVEAKCPQPHTHIKYLMDGCLPADYVGQVQAALLAAEADKWHFSSYCHPRGCAPLPELILEVGRDEKYISTLRDALELFNEKMELYWQKLVKINGGEPKRKVVATGEGELTLDGVSPDSLDEFFKSTAYQRIDAL